jgi:hypothetical protein
VLRASRRDTYYGHWLGALLGKQGLFAGANAHWSDRAQTLSTGIAQRRRALSSGPASMLELAPFQAMRLAAQPIEVVSGV